MNRENTNKNQSANNQKINLLIAGLAKTGKTYGAHLIASGIGGKVLYLDTENRARHTGRKLGLNFTYQTLTNPTIEQFMLVYQQAKQVGYDTIVIDSASEEYEDYLERGYASDPEKFTYSAKFGRPHKDFIKLIATDLIATDGDINTIVTCRADEVEDRGKNKYLKLIQEKTFKNAFLIVFETLVGYNVCVTADGTFIFEPDSVFKLTKETGEKLAQGVQMLNQEDSANTVVDEFKTAEIALKSVGKLADFLEKYELEDIYQANPKQLQRAMEYVVKAESISKRHLRQ